jgi:multiple sugar transport system ATP-binding protein
MTPVRSALIRKPACPAFVDVVEMLGAETYLYVTVNSELTLTARVDPTVSHSKAGEVSITGIDGSRVHLFDKETEKVILS